MQCRIITVVILSQVLLACASHPGQDTHSPRLTAIYSPPVRLGGNGSMIFIPAPAQREFPAVRTSLETPDPVPLQPTGKWLRGTWLHDASADDLPRTACNSATTMTYHADGTTSFFEGKGRWRLAGDILTTKLTEIHETSDPDDPYEVGKAFSSQVRRLGPDEGATSIGGKWLPMLRCRPGDIR